MEEFVKEYVNEFLIRAIDYQKVKHSHSVAIYETGQVG
jgi:hypothetical protein